MADGAESSESTWRQLCHLGKLLGENPRLATTATALQIIVVPTDARHAAPCAEDAEPRAVLDLTSVDVRNTARAVVDYFEQNISSMVKLMAGDLDLDPWTFRVTRRGRLIHLGPTDFRILHALLRCRGTVLSQSQLHAIVWGRTRVEMRTIDVHIRRLRKALTQHGEPDVIQTIRGRGYAFGVGNSGEDGHSTVANTGDEDERWPR